MPVPAQGHQRSRSLPGMLCNVHAFPDSDMMPDTLDILSGVRISPGYVRVKCVTQANMEVARCVFYRTDVCALVSSWLRSTANG
jgi:hypothetical protein